MSAVTPPANVSTFQPSKLPIRPLLSRMSPAITFTPTMASILFLAAGAATTLLLWYRLCLQPNKSNKPNNSNDSLRIAEIYIYPIKSLRPTTLDAALATQHGLEHDRVFMLLHKTPQGYKNMAVSHYPDMTQFLTSIRPAQPLGRAIVQVHFRAFGNQEKAKTIDIPLQPVTEKLTRFNVNMHGSPTTAFEMPEEYSAWFSECFGYHVVLVYLGDNKRKVLWKDMVPSRTTSWLSRTPLLGRAMLQTPEITFADCAPYLAVSSTSLQDVSSRLGPNESMDVTKFRPNIVISGAHQAWEEDYWCRIRVGNLVLGMKHNCVRCASLNIDYDTGKPGTGESGQVLKKLQKDRRIDKGAKWSPVFGRYAFWTGKSHEQVINVGDEVVVTDFNNERTIFSKYIRQVCLCKPHLQS